MHLRPRLISKNENVNKSFLKFFIANVNLLFSVFLDVSSQCLQANFFLSSVSAQSWFIKVSKKAKKSKKSKKVKKYTLSK